MATLGSAGTATPAPAAPPAAPAPAPAPAGTSNDNAKIDCIIRLLADRISKNNNLVKDIDTDDLPNTYRDLNKEKARRLVAEKTLQMSSMLKQRMMPNYINIMLYKHLSEHFDDTLINFNKKAKDVLNIMNRIYATAPPTGPHAPIEMQAQAVAAVIINGDLPADATARATALAALNAKANDLVATMNRVYRGAAGAPIPGVPPGTPFAGDLYAQAAAAVIINGDLPAPAAGCWCWWWSCACSSFSSS